MKPKNIMIFTALATIAMLLGASGIILEKYLTTQDKQTSSELSKASSPIADANQNNEAVIENQNNSVLLASQSLRSQTATVHMAFQQAYENFDGRIIQIENCMAIPGMAALPTNVTYKNGTRIMLDNRSQDPLEISLGGKAYRLYGYEYTFVTLKSDKLPTTLSMDCQMGDDVGKNIAQITLQL